MRKGIVSGVVAVALLLLLWIVIMNVQDLSLLSQYGTHWYVEDSKKPLTVEKYTLAFQYGNPPIVVSPVYHDGSKLTREFIVHLETSDNAELLAEKYGVEIVGSFSFSENTYIFKARSPIMSLVLANELRDVNGVESAYPNWLRKYDLMESS